MSYLKGGDEIRAVHDKLHKLRDSNLLHKQVKLTGLELLQLLDMLEEVQSWIECAEADQED